MAVLAVNEGEGWAGIAAALAHAQSGDRVEIGPGQFEGGETLLVGSGVTLAGSDGHSLIYTGNDAAIAVRQAVNVSLAAICLYGYAGLKRSDNGVPESERTNGLISISRSRRVTLTGCMLAAAARHTSCINAMWSSDVVVTECRVTGAKAGIIYHSTAGRIENNECWGNGSGINLQSNPANPYQPSRATLRANRCHDNGEVGIGLASSECDAIENNECWGNGGSGIVLMRDPANPDEPSRATLRANRCHGNGGAGIGLASSECDAIENNECWGNGGSGIALARGPAKNAQPSRATLRANRCHGNREAGIGLASSESDAIENNECWGNAGGGIALTLGPAKNDQPSRAPLRANRCHNNKMSGILLASSESDAIENNECWGNAGGGIVLTLGPAKNDQPSRAPLRANRCHDNGQGGIVLFSSESGMIESNECWGNYIAGISLQSARADRVQPSRATLRANRCHDNGKVGIMIASSESDAIENNECWGNGGSGIALARAPWSPDQPSHAVVSQNQLQRNGMAAIRFSNSGGKAWANRSRGNGIDGVAIEATRLPATDVELVDNVTDAALDLPATVFPELRSALRAVDPPLTQGGKRDETALAEYLMTGCSGCFRAFWIGHRRAPDPQEEKDGPPPDPRHWWVRVDSAKLELQRRGFVNRSRGPATPLTDLVAQIRRWCERFSASDPEAHWVALVTPMEDDLKVIADDLRAFADGQASEGFVLGGRLGVPIDVDMGEGQETLRDRLSATLVDGRKANVGTWIAEALRLPVVLAVVAVIVTVLVLGPLALWLLGETDTLQSLLRQIFEWKGDAEEKSVFWSLISGLLNVSAFGVLVTFIDCFLPTYTSLAKRVEKVEESGIVGFFGSSIVKFQKLCPDFFAGARGKADLTWQMRRLFRGSTTAAALILRDVTCWHDGDLDWLGRLALSVPASHKLITVIQIDGRLSLRPLLIDQTKAPWRAGFDLYLNDDQQRVRLQQPTSSKTPHDDASNSGATLARLLGIDADTARGLKGDITNDLWTPTDLLPGLPIASAPTARADLEKPETSDPVLQMVALRQDFQAAQALYVAAPDLDLLERQRQVIGTLFGVCRIAPAIASVDASKDRKDIQKLTGRLSGRRALGDVLYSIIGEASVWREYIASALRFGIWQRADRLTQYITKEGQEIDLLALQRGLDAIAFLQTELDTILEGASCPLHGQELIDEAFKGLQQAIASLPAMAGVGAVVLRYLGAENRCLKRLSAWSQEIVGAIEVAANLIPNRPSLETPHTAGEQFCADILRELIGLRALEVDAAQARLDELAQWRWASMPETLRQKLTALALDRSRYLVRVFAEADNRSALEHLVRLHRRQPERTFYALGCVALHHVHERAIGTGDSQKLNRDLAAVGATLIKLREQYLARDKTVSFLTLNEAFAEGAEGAALGSAVVFELMAEARAADWIAGSMADTRDEELDYFEALLAEELGKLPAAT